MKKIIIIAFILISVVSLILYDQYESNLEWQEKGGPLIAQDSQKWIPDPDNPDYDAEKQRKIDSLIASDSSYTNNPLVKSWEQARLGTLQTDDDSAFNACVANQLGKYYTPQTAEEFYKLSKVQQACSFLLPDYEEDFTDDFETDYTEKFD